MTEAGFFPKDDDLRAVDGLLAVEAFARGYFLAFVVRLLLLFAIANLVVAEVRARAHTCAHKYKTSPHL